MPISYSRMTAIGSYVPERILSNEDLEAMVDTSDEWIVKRTGIRERRISSPEQFTSHLCIEAVRNLADRWGASLHDVEMIIVSTSTPDYSFPNTASRVQEHLGIPSAGTIDLSAACAGFVYGLHIANGLITSGLHRKVLVIGADTLSKITDYTDRTTCILFGDAAGAVLVERDDNGGAFLAHHFETDGTGGRLLYRNGLSAEWDEKENSTFIVQNGREVYRFAVQSVPQGVRKLLEAAGDDPDSIDWFIPHSANMRIIDSLCEKTGMPPERTLSSLEFNGNTSAASIPLALDQAVKEGAVKAGDRLLMYGFGGGLTHGGIIAQWG